MECLPHEMRLRKAIFEGILGITMARKWAVLLNGRFPTPLPPKIKKFHAETIKDQDYFTQDHPEINQDHT